MKKGFNFRVATINDLKDVIDLNFELFKYEYLEFNKSLNLDWTNKEGKNYFRRKIIKDDGFVEVAEEGGKLVGYICGGISKRAHFRINAKYAELENMYVKPRFRNKGLGMKLVKDFKSWCAQNRVNYLEVAPETRNKKAMRFYKKRGFGDYQTTLEIVLGEQKSA